MKTSTKFTAAAATFIASLSIVASSALATSADGNLDVSGSVLVANSSLDDSRTSSNDSRVDPDSERYYARIQGFTRLSELERSALILNLKADAKFRLLGPEVAILATIERVDKIEAMFRLLAAKLEAKIDQYATTTNRVELRSLLSDMNSNLAAATVQINAAQTLALGIKADNGSEAIMKANLALLKDARIKTRAAVALIKDARKDAHLIVNILF